MGSRRAPSRGSGAGERSGLGGDGEDDGPVWTPGPASRSYLLSVRPETSLPGSRLSHPSSGRSTFCSIIAQLTEETQPLFETTLKSRAVSKDSDVRFTCIVTGYPEPEVTWYKDDTELDRYCGLPKYKITHQGNRHTLQLYRCQEEDAAIYQASAQNTKGIVSCSGVLEVGTMTEFKIHQRWFARLKRKAAAKLREMEQSWKQGKEATAAADPLRQLSPDRFQRKRRLSGAQVPTALGAPREAEDRSPAWPEGATEPAQCPGLVTGEVTTNGEAAPEDGENGERGLLTYICEAIELGAQTAPRKESGVKKKKKDEGRKQDLRKPEPEKVAPGQHSENSVPASNKPDSRGTQGPVDTKQVQAWPRGRAVRGPGSSGVDATKKPASSVGAPDKAQDVPAPALAPAPAPTPVLTPAPAPISGPGQEVCFSLRDLYLENAQAALPQEEGAGAPGGRAPGETSGKAAGERGPAAPSQPMLGLAPQPAGPFNRKRFAAPKPKGEPPTTCAPTSARSHTPDSGAPDLEHAPPQAPALVPTPPARQRHSTRDSPLQGQAGRGTPVEGLEAPAAMAPLSASSSGSQGASGSRGAAELMDTEQNRSRSAEGAATGEETAEEAAAGAVQADREAPGGVGGQADVSPQELGTQAGRTQVDGEGQEAEKDGTTQVVERTEDNRGAQEEAGWRAGACVPRAAGSQTGPGSQRSLSVGSPQDGGYSEQTPEGPPVREKPGLVLSPEVASGNRVEAVQGALSRGLTPQGQLPPQACAEQLRAESDLPWEALPGAGPIAGPVRPPLLGTGLPSTPTSLLSGAQALHLGSGTPAQSHPPDTSAAGSGGACAPGPQSCDPGLIDSLKNYLLLLLKLSSADPGEPEADPAHPAPSASPGLGPPAVEVAGLSPRTSRRILERAENDHLVRSAQTLLLSPCTSRRLTGLLDREAQAAQQALAAAPGAWGPRPVPAIVVGEEGPALPPEGGLIDGGEGASPESPTFEGSPPEGSAGGPLGAGGGQALVQGSPSAKPRAAEPLGEEGAPEEGPADLPAATPEELALGARRKRLLPKVRSVGEGEASKSEERDSPSVSPRGPRKGLAPGGPGTPERRSPTQGRRAGLLGVPGAEEEPGPSAQAGGPQAELAPEEGPQEAAAKPRKPRDLLKAPQVIRKIRVEQFPDASGSLKLWCQFFNVLSDSVLTWTKDQRPVGEASRSAGEEGPAALAIVQAAPVDCGVYRCTLRNEHGSASTDFCLSPEVLSGFISREEGEVGEEIEMTPMVFAKGLADSGCWGDKLFGRLVSEELRGGGHSFGLQKASQAKVIYGLEPIFDSGRTCIIKVSSLLVFGPSSETSLLGRNYDVTIQGCKIQNMSREYCKIFAAEARAVPGFGEVPEIIPLYLIYRPANNIPYATLEEDLGKPLQSYCSRERGCAGVPEVPGSSEVMQKCQTFQHWLYQWTNGSFLVTDLAGVAWKMTDVQIATKLRGYQGLKESCFPALLDEFAGSHQCSAFCAMLGLQPLRGPEAAQPQAKAKGSKSPSGSRKGPQLSPQPQKKGPPSPQGSRKSAPSSKATPQAPEGATAQSLGQPPPQGTR
ncbi:alpha-protein kinase 3 [Tamandua tetradactyla]|uniref:alpha-protein kinase 3 n=1 Tax=Tamandua tetradactyla TaxID=48850 RepID=UPI0040546491